MHHLFADNTKVFFFLCPPDLDSNITHTQNALQQIYYCFNSQLFKHWVFLTGLSNWLKLTPAHLTQYILLLIFVLFLTNILPFLSRYLLSLILLTGTHTFVDLLYPSVSWSLNTIAAFIVHSELDYCNSLYYNLPNSRAKTSSAPQEFSCLCYSQSS